jgi:hypothetical protein
MAYAVSVEQVDSVLYLFCSIVTIRSCAPYLTASCHVPYCRFLTKPVVMHHATPKSAHLEA